MEERVHPIPFRTWKLSSPSPMILHNVMWESRPLPTSFKAPRCISRGELCCFVPGISAPAAPARMLHGLLPRPAGLHGHSAILLRGQGSFMRDPRCPQHSAFRAKACLGPRPKIFKKPFAAQAPRAFAVYGCRICFCGKMTRRAGCMDILQSFCMVGK